MRAGHLYVMAACGMMAACGERAELVHVEIDTPIVAGVEMSSALPAVDPPEAVVAIGRRGPGRAAFVVREDAGDLRIDLRGACPTTIGAAELQGAARSGKSVRRELDPLFRIEGELAQVGYGEAFELRVAPSCGVAEAATLEWEVVGAPIEALSVLEEGRHVRGRMPGFEDTWGLQPLPFGVVPISPANRGTRSLRLRARLGDGALVERTVDVHAAARATGVPSVTTGMRTYVAGRDLTILQAPREAEPTFAEISPGLFAFVPDRPGRYVFVTPERQGFSVAAGRHVDTPLDCGRPECHASATMHATRSPMTTVFARLLERDDHAPGCAVTCHAVGEPGTRDGGLVAVATELGVGLPARGSAEAHARLPRALRRLTGVGCTSCHGPGAIPEPGAAEKILRAEVCAVCHDAPPRYGHVVAWRSSRMARADVHDGVASRDECRRCHTTEGFLGRGNERHGEAEIHRQGHAVGTGIACAACHAPHAAETDASLLRRAPLPALIDGLDTTLERAPSRVCASCHAPDPELDAPTSGAVALLVGRGAFARDGQPLRLEAPHARLERGCLSCHGSTRSEVLERGAGHDFGVDPAVCDGCHLDLDAAVPARLRARADALAARLHALGAPPPTPADPRPGRPKDALARARWNVSLVRFDRGAFAHAGRTADTILDETEALLDAEH